MILDALAAAKSTMNTADVAKAVTDAGYKTTSKSFNNVISARLAVLTEVKRVEPGQYALKGKTVAAKPAAEPKQKTTRKKAERKSKKAPRGLLKKLIIKFIGAAPAGSLSIAEVCEAVTGAGYKSVSSDFKNLVSTKLGIMDEVKRVAPGRYAINPDAPKPKAKATKKAKAPKKAAPKAPEKAK